jgi:hypothetical protein
MTRFPFCTPLAFAALFLNCTARPPIAVEVSRGNSVESLTFTITARDSSKPLVSMLSVTSSRGRARGTNDTWLWSIVRDAQVEPAKFPLNVRYGELPVGFTAPSQAIPLTAGHTYEVHVKASGIVKSVYFRVRTDGKVE